MSCEGRSTEPAASAENAHTVSNKNLLLVVKNACVQHTCFLISFRSPLYTFPRIVCTEHRVSKLINYVRIFTDTISLICGRSFARRLPTVQLDFCNSKPGVLNCNILGVPGNNALYSDLVKQSEILR